MASVPPPPDRPTQPLRPSPPPPVVEERVVERGVDLGAALARLEHSLESLRTGLMIVGALSVLALGIAIYALLDDDGGGGSRAGLASDERVSRLDDRVDRLSRQVRGVRADAREGATLEDRVASVERTVETLAERPAAGDATQAVEELSQRIDDLATDVERLEQQAEP